MSRGCRNWPERTVFSQCGAVYAQRLMLTLTFLGHMTALLSKSPLTTVRRGALGPPSHFNGLDEPGKFLSVSRECSVSGEEINFEVVRVAARPDIFHIGGLLSAAECDSIIAAGHARGMSKATTAGGDERNGCSVAWLGTSGAQPDETAAAISAACEQLLLQPDLVGPSQNGFENMQVLRYTKGGTFELHYDANEQTHRVLTVLLYLNGVGETWFPLALRDPRDAESVAGSNPPRHTALAAARQLTPHLEGPWLEPCP